MLLGILADGIWHLAIQCLNDVWICIAVTDIFKFGHLGICMRLICHMQHLARVIQLTRSVMFSLSNLRIVLYGPHPRAASPAPGTVCTDRGPRLSACNTHQKHNSN